MIFFKLLNLNEEKSFVNFEENKSPIMSFDQLMSSDFTYISHRWDRQDNPDPNKHQFSETKESCSGYVLYDYSCLKFEHCDLGALIQFIMDILKQKKIMILTRTSVNYHTRSWCFFEWLLSSSKQYDDDRFFRSFKRVRNYMCFNKNRNKLIDVDQVIEYDFADESFIRDIKDDKLIISDISAGKFQGVFSFKFNQEGIDHNEVSPNLWLCFKAKTKILQDLKLFGALASEIQVKLKDRISNEIKESEEYGIINEKINMIRSEINVVTELFLLCSGLEQNDVLNMKTQDRLVYISRYNNYLFDFGKEREEVKSKIKPLLEMFFDCKKTNNELLKRMSIKLANMVSKNVGEVGKEVTNSVFSKHGMLEIHEEDVSHIIERKISALMRMECCRTVLFLSCLSSNNKHETKMLVESLEDELRVNKEDIKEYLKNMID